MKHTGEEEIKVPHLWICGAKYGDILIEQSIE